MNCFEKYFKFPLRYDENGMYIWDACNHMAAMYDYEGVPFDEEVMSGIVSVINGEKTREDVPYLVSREFEYDDQEAIITEKETGKVAIIMRGWGYLTARGHCNLSQEEARNAQDGLAGYIIDKLNGKH